MRTSRGSYVASDHHPVVSKMKLKLRKHWTAGETELQRPNTSLFEGTKKIDQFKITLNIRFHAVQVLLEEDETVMKGNWKQIKEALTSTCKEVLNLMKHHHNEWISMETLDRIQKGRTERQQSKTAS
ncbi:unnamed protein product [Schistosoma curassoni]|uniref:Endo/exonuclease/phosphatase domain-containing protein n=1 Tax=Schistosoma curassoni TaxID=6186 RepID=A0A183K3I3_9TREM|nr:unnamed protein product [Schistosoma curassoni]